MAHRHYAAGRRCVQQPFANADATLQARRTLPGPSLHDDSKHVKRAGCDPGGVEATPEAWNCYALFGGWSRGRVVIDGGNGIAARVQQPTRTNQADGASIRTGSTPAAHRKQACGASGQPASVDVPDVLWFVQPSGQYSASAMTSTNKITTRSPATILSTLSV